MLCGKSDEKTGLTPRNLLGQSQTIRDPRIVWLCFFGPGAGRAGRPRPFPILTRNPAYYCPISGRFLNFLTGKYRV